MWMWPNDCVYDIRDRTSDPELSPPPPSSLTDVHWCIGYHNPNWYSLSKSMRLTCTNVRPRMFFCGPSRFFSNNFMSIPSTFPHRSTHHHFTFLPQQFLTHTFPLAFLHPFRQSYRTYTGTHTTCLYNVVFFKVLFWKGSFLPCFLRPYWCTKHLTSLLRHVHTSRDVNGGRASWKTKN